MRRIIFGGIIAALIVSCYPKGPVYVSDLDLVATDYDDSFNFNDQQTFYLFDTVMHITDNDKNIDRTWDELTLESVEGNMLSRGFTPAEDPLQADVILTISAWSNTSVNYYYDWYSYWGWGYPGYGPGWGWGYPGGYTYVYSYTFGTVLIEMSYLVDVSDESKEIPIIWTGLINGLLDGSDSSIGDRVESSINQTFEQSPYIQAQ